MINLRTPALRYREHSRQERLRTVFERRMSIMLAREFRRLSRDPSSIVTHERVLARIFTIIYTQVFDNFGKQLFQALRKIKADEETDAINAARVRFLKANVGEKVSEVSNTSREKIKRIIADAEERDLPSSEIADLLEESIGGDIGDRRAMTIARTEVHSASQDSQFEAAQATGLNLRKRWVATEDSRTREDHLQADGQVIDMEESFEVGDDELLYAGDPDGSPEQIINCRCITVYEEASNG